MEGQGRLALVTGGAGFIGGHLCEGRVAAGWQVRVLDDLSSGSEANLAAVSDRVALIEADLCDSASLARALKGVRVTTRIPAKPALATARMAPPTFLGSAGWQRTTQIRPRGSVIGETPIEDHRRDQRR